MNDKNKELSSLDKLKNILRRKADDGVKISVAKAGWVLNLAYAAGQHKAVKDAKGLKWVELPIKISGCTRFGTSYDIYRNVHINSYMLKYNNGFIRVCNTIEEAKEIAEKDYKNKLKECLL